MCRLAPCAVICSWLAAPNYFGTHTILLQYERLDRLSEIVFVEHAENEETAHVNGNNLCQMVRDQENELLGEIWKDEVGLVDS